MTASGVFILLFVIYVSKSGIFFTKSIIVAVVIAPVRLQIAKNDTCCLDKSKRSSSCVTI